MDFGDSSPKSQLLTAGCVTLGKSLTSMYFIFFICEMERIIIQMELLGRITDLIVVKHPGKCHMVSDRSQSLMDYHGFILQVRECGEEKRGKDNKDMALSSPLPMP